MDDRPPVAPRSGPAPWVRWLALPYALLVVLVAAIALNAEERQVFIDRRADDQAIERLTGDDVPFDASRIIIDTPDGPVEITTDGERVVGEDALGQAQVMRFIEDPDGDIVGFRVNPDGTFSPVRVGDDTEGATIIRPNTSGGFDVVRPDGTRVSVENENGELVARDMSSDAGPVPLGQNPDGTIQLDEELFVGPSDLPPLDLEALPANPRDGPNGLDGGGDGGSTVNWSVILIALAALLALGLGVWFFIAMAPEAAPAGIGAVAATPAIRRYESADPWAAFEAYLNDLRADPDPTHAIRLAFAYTEGGVGTLPVRDSEETPYEWLDRARQLDPQGAELLRPLLERYVAIRFGGHIAEDAERQRSVNDLRTLVYTVCGATSPAANDSASPA